MARTNEQIARGTAFLSLGGNLLLTGCKLFAGIFAHSAAMISDAVHSLSDVVGDLIVFVGIGLSGKKLDKEHPYGHERMECVAALALAFLLFSASLGIGWGGLRTIFGGNYGELEIPGGLALAAALFSIVLKESMYWITRRAAKKTDSVVLMAAAWHHRTDALSSVGSFAGIFGARLGFPVLDSVASVVICLFILKVAVDIFRNAVGKMTDRACDDGLVGEVTELALAQADVSGVDLIKTRLFGNKIYVDIEISVDGASTLCKAHDAAHRVHDAIEGAFPKVKHCMVHVNPALAEIQETESQRG